MKTIYTPKTNEREVVKCHHFTNMYERMVEKDEYVRGQVVECDHGNRWVVRYSLGSIYYNMRKLRPWHLSYYKVGKEVDA